jgi:hypothetical protein
MDRQFEQLCAGIAIGIERGVVGLQQTPVLAAHEEDSEGLCFRLKDTQARASPA